MSLKSMKSNIPTESDEAKALKTWADYHPIARLMFHIPNGGSRHLYEAVNLRAQGAKAGIPDYFLPYPCHGKAGMFIELKRAEGGRLTKTQAECLKKLDSLGYKAVVAYGWEHAVKEIEEYLR